MSVPSCAGTSPNLPPGCVPSWPACGAKSRKRIGRGTRLFVISTTFAPSSSVSTLNDARDQPDCKGNDGRDDRPIQKATMIQEEGRTARRPQVLTDECG